ncbi:hypothetical protein K474DRAFT_1772229 [Panus rudis PR-1116 ss-1]|nr:hypothetical protein K474DRAFT_1772229 [Panus rudis PR-1116 ss-1]
MRYVLRFTSIFRSEGINIQIWLLDLDNKTRIRRSRKTLSILTAHTRTYHIFPLFAPLITLLHAYLAYALGNRERAEVCYVVAGRLAGADLRGGADLRSGNEGGRGGGGEDDFVYVASRAGLVALDLVRARDSLGLGGSGAGNGTGSSPSGGLEKKKENAMSRKPHLYTNTKDEEDVKKWQWKWEISVKEGIRSRRGRGMGGTLNAIGHILEACFSGEMLRANTNSLDRQHLKQALTLATSSQDNHLRALILALIASQYFYTAGDHAAGMLRTCEQLAAGLGAPVNKEKEKAKVQSVSGGGNASPATGENASTGRVEGIPGNAVLGLLGLGLTTDAGCLLSSPLISPWPPALLCSLVPCVDALKRRTLQIVVDIHTLHQNNQQQQKPSHSVRGKVAASKSKPLRTVCSSLL